MPQGIFAVLFGTLHLNAWERMNVMKMYACGRFSVASIPAGLSVLPLTAGAPGRIKRRRYRSLCKAALIFLLSSHAVASVVFDADGKAVLSPLPEPGVKIYVAADGSDGGDGTEAHPFATLERARDRVREISRQLGIIRPGGIHILIGSGRYEVTRTFELRAEDSSPTSDVLVYRAMDGARPVFTGGVRLSGFASVSDDAILARLPEDARGKVMQVDLNQYGIKEQGPLILGGCAGGNGFKTHPVIEVFWDDEALQMARYPNDGVLYVADICVPDGHSIHGISGSKTGRFIYDGERPARWKDEKDPLLYGYWFWDWADSYERIAAIDTGKREITLAKPYHTYGYRKGARFYAVNMLCEIDMPGEWYIDREKGVLYIYPPSDPEKAKVELSILSSPMLKMDNVRNVQFQGLTWELCGSDVITVNGGNGCLFAGCTVRKSGGNGIEVKGGQGHGIVSCDIHMMGRGGIVLSGGDRKTLTPGGHFVANCDIHHLSRIDHTYTPAAIVDGVGNRVIHNRMHHINSSALRINGNEHLIEYNEVHDVLLESDDQGGADMWGNPTFRGNVYRYNYWHHIGNWRGIGEILSCGHAGIRLDDAICGTLIHGNVFYKCSGGQAGFGGVQIHGGKENIVENNIFVECAAAISFSQWGEKRWNDFTAKSLDSPDIDAALYQTRYPALAHLAENPDINTIQRNLVWKCGKFLLRDNDRNISADNVITEDGSYFAKAAAGDFSIGSTARMPAGFAAIPFEKIGLYVDELRRELPLKEIAEARAR